MLTNSGAKLLDLGLAKLTQPSGTAQAQEVTASPTLSLAATHAGVILGTAACMAPEQAKGKPADARNDLWACGCVLYEMLTGACAFTGQDATVVLGAVVRLDPDWNALPQDTPAAIRALLRTCLAKDASKRITDATGALFVIDNLAALRDVPAVRLSSAQPRWRRVAIGTSVFALGGMAIGVPLWWATRSAPSRVERFAFAGRGPTAREPIRVFDHRVPTGISSLSDLRCCRCKQTRLNTCCTTTLRADDPRGAATMWPDEVIFPPPVVYSLRSSSKLDGWKAIAAYFGRTVRTVQRWERHEELPVHRLPHKALGSIYAYPHELVRWAAHREARASDPAFHAPIHRLRTGRAVALEASEALLRARHFMSLRTWPSLLRAIRAYRDAIDIEAAWALPRAGLGEAYVAASGSEFLAPLDGYPRARAAALEALEIDPGLGSAHAVLGFVHAFHDADWAVAQAAFNRGLEAEPGSGLCYYFLGLMLMNRGEFAQASGAIQQAVNLHPLSAAMTANMSRPLICAWDWSGAIDWCDRALVLDPDFWFAHLFKGWALDGSGAFDAAYRSLKTAVRLGGSLGVAASLAHALAKAGRRRQAEVAWADLRTSPSYVSPVRLARIAVALDLRDEALRLLERAGEEGSLRSNCYPHYDYALAPLRNEPRFRQVLVTLNLPAGARYCCR